MNRIKLIITLSFSAWLFSSSLMAASTSWSMGTFRHLGVVDEVSRNWIFIDDTKYRLSPTAKLATTDNSKASINLLKRRQMIGFSTITINNRQLIDQIWLIPENEQRLYRPIP